ncbi:MAG: hypothetical protein R6V02_08105 [Candidatus Aminicenantes bacterium]
MTNQKKWKPALAAVLAVGMVLTAFPEQARATDICIQALEKCGIDVAISFLIAGWHGAALLAAGCINGYVFCQKYFQK